MVREKLAKLIDVKSMVTLLLTATFIFLNIRGNIPQEFMTIYTVVVSFFFGTQMSKKTGDNIVPTADKEE